MAQQWDSLGLDTTDAGVSQPKCPKFVDAAEADSILDAAMKQEEADSQMEVLRNVIGISADGWVHPRGQCRCAI